MISIKSRLWAVVFLLFQFQPSWAGSIINKQNFSSEYIGSLSRNAAMDAADVVVYNPAATVLLDDGWTIKTDLMYYDKRYSNKINSLSYESTEPSLVPSIFATYHNQDVAYFAAVTVPGGGGKVDYADGNATTISVGSALLATVGAPYDSINNHSIRADSAYLRYTFGAAYLVNDIFSISGGLGYVDAYKKAKGSVSINSSALPLPTITSAFDYKQEAEGWGAFLGANFNLDKTNVGLRYESSTKLDFKSNVREASQDSGNPALDAFPVAVLAANGVIDGEQVREDLPAVFALGIAHEFTPDWMLHFSATLYFEEQAQLDSSRLQQAGNGHEYALAIEHDVSPNLLATFGIMKTNVDLNSDYLLAEAPELDAISYACGLRWHPDKSWSVSAGALYVDYATATNSQTVRFDKSIWSLSAGVSYHFK